MGTQTCRNFDALRELPRGIIPGIGMLVVNQCERIMLQCFKAWFDIADEAAVDKLLQQQEDDHEKRKKQEEEEFLRVCRECDDKLSEQLKELTKLDWTAEERLVELNDLEFRLCSYQMRTVFAEEETVETVEPGIAAMVVDVVVEVWTTVEHLTRDVNTWWDASVCQLLEPLVRQ